ncbi:hypothetical protein [Pokkaliibacter plantistimulans]|nr:hypothetical protein [Pokkaliibacter plantistimulans]
MNVASARTHHDFPETIRNYREHILRVAATLTAEQSTGCELSTAALRTIIEKSAMPDFAVKRWLKEGGYTILRGKPTKVRHAKLFVGIPDEEDSVYRYHRYEQSHESYSDFWQRLISQGYSLKATKSSLIRYIESASFLLQDADIKGVLSDWASGYSNHHIALRHGVRRESIDQWIASLPKARLKEAQSQAATCTSIDFIRYAEQYRQVCRRLHEELGLPLRALSQRYSLTLVTLIRWSREESWETTPLEQVGVKLGFIIKTT